MSDALEPWRHAEAVVNGVKLHLVEAGAGPLVILLHGFPEHWYAWRHQIPALASAGFRVIAPDLRGYNLSEKPRGVRQYRLDELARDIAALVHHAGAERAHVVGHDWGGMVAWWVGIFHPEVVDRLAILNAPHPAVFPLRLFRNGQLRKSSYILYFQLPGLAEWRVARDDFAILRKYLRRDPVDARAFSEEDIRRYVAAIRQPGALSAALNYYRAALRASPILAVRARRQILSPVLVMWGEQDRYLGAHLIEGTERWVKNLRVVRVAAASHWIQADAPETVNEELLAFLKADHRIG